MKFKILAAFSLCTALFYSCEKEIEIDLPPGETNIVIEGSIESGAYPLVTVTRSIPYYTPINNQTLANMFVGDATASVVVGNDTVPLIKFCLADIPDSLREQVKETLNLPKEFNNFCVFTSLDSRLLGKTGTSYTLLVNADGKQIKSTTYIPQPVALDSLWFKVDGDKDSLGFLWANMTDPAESGNGYRWFAQRINHYTYGELKGQQKDADFVSPFQSAFNDEFFNGLTFPFAFNRGVQAGSEKQDDEEERGYFKRGDTVVVKFASIDNNVYQYWRSFYNSIGNSGSPFASPANVRSNVKGGLGVWAGYGNYLDTIVIP